MYHDAALLIMPCWHREGTYEHVTSVSHWRESSSKFRLGSEACRKGAYAMLLEMVQLMMVEKAYLALRQFLPSPSTYYFCLL